MKRLLVFVGLCALLISSAAITTNTSSAASAAVENLSPETNRELARARNATAKYHNFETADDDNYDFLACVPGEGLEFVKWSIVDCNFDIEEPEALHYVPDGNKMKLVGVEYVIPVACSATPPAGFTGDNDEWEFMAEGLPIWSLRVALWLPNPDGMFKEKNPRIPDVCP